MGVKELIKLAILCVLFELNDELSHFALQIAWCKRLEKVVKVDIYIPPLT